MFWINIEDREELLMGTYNIEFSWKNKKNEPQRQKTQPRITKTWPL